MFLIFLVGMKNENGKVIIFNYYGDIFLLEEIK